MDGLHPVKQAGSMNAFTIFHVLLSLIGIMAGFVVVFGMIGSKLCRGWTTIFLGTTLASSVTGIMFPFHGFTPAFVFGILSCVVLGFAFHALYGKKLFGGWAKVYVVTAVIAQYLNFFVLIAQSFQKISFLHQFAPMGQEPAFGLAQGAALLFFLVLGMLGARKFHPAAPLA